MATSRQQSNAAGHFEFLRDGLHVYTDDNTGKAAGYFAMSGGLPDSASMNWIGTQPQPGQQIRFDIDSDRTNGNEFNAIVGEPIYGDDWWMTGGTTRAAARGITCPDTSGGHGSDCHGTLAEWQAAVPNAEVYAGGFSLGSGIEGDGVIQSITYDDTSYRFTSDPETTEADVTGDFVATKHDRTVRIILASHDQPANTTEGEKLRWVIKVDGRVVARITQGFDDRDSWRRTFTKRTGMHNVTLLKNGEQVYSKNVWTGKRR